MIAQRPAPSTQPLPPPSPKMEALPTLEQNSSKTEINPLPVVCHPTRKPGSAPDTPRATAHPMAQARHAPPTDPP